MGQSDAPPGSPGQRLTLEPGPALLPRLGEMVRAANFQNEVQFHAAEAGGGWPSRELKACRAFDNVIWTKPPVNR